MDYKIERKRIEWLLEQLYLFFAGIYVLYFFIGTTMFVIEWPALFFENLQILLSVLTFARIAYSEKYNNKELMLFVLVSLSFLMLWKRNELGEIVNILVLIIGAKGISWRKMLKLYWLITTIALVVTVVAALTGNVENLIYYQEGRRARISFGIIYPTDFSAHIFYSALIYCYLRGEKIRYIELGFVAVLGIFVYIFCEARLNTICIMAVFCVFFYHKQRCRSAYKQNRIYEMNSFLSWLLAMSTIFCAVVSVLGTMYYDSQNRVFDFLNGLLNGRLKLGKKAIDLYGFSISGQYIPTNGNGGRTKKILYYFFIDNSYVSIVLKLGIVLFAIILLMFLVIAFRARREKDWTMLWMIALMSVQCIIEHHILDVAYCPIIIALFANTRITDSDLKVWVKNIFARRNSRLCVKK